MANGPIECLVERLFPLFGLEMRVCPFHEEKAPSFYRSFLLDHDTGKYRCYKCGKEGLIKELGEEKHDR